MAQTKIRSSKQLFIDNNLDLNSKKITSLTAGSAAGEAVEYNQLITAINDAISGAGNSLHTPVADLASAKLVLTTDTVVGGIVTVGGRTDKMIMLIETLGLYRYDAESLAVSNDDTVIRPTDITTDANSGRWIKISSTLTDHNLMSGKQGGTTNEYFHLTQIELTKLGGIAENANNYSHPNHSGDVTSSGDGATTIAAKAVTLAKMADMDTASFLGRNTASVGVPEILSISTVKTMLGITNANRVYKAVATYISNGLFRLAGISALNGTEEVFLNGQLMNMGSDNDYTVTYITNLDIQFIGDSLPTGSDVVLINYSV